MQELKWWTIRLGMCASLAVMAGLLMGLLFAAAYVPPAGTKVNTDRPLPDYITEQYEDVPPVVDGDMQF